MTMAKPKTELGQRCPPPPYMRWDQRGRPVLQASMKLTDGSTMSVMLDTDDTEIAQQRIRPLIVSAIADGLLPAESRPARLYGVYDRPDFWAEMSRLAALGQAQYDAERAAAEKRFDLPVWIIDRLAKREPRPVGPAAYRKRRFRARQRGEQTAMGTSWHHRPQGEKYFFRNGRVMNGRLHLACRVYQWSLKTRVAEVAAAVMAPVRLARKRVREAAVEVLGCELGTAAAEAAAAAREEACRRLAEAIIVAGGPMEAAKFVVEASPDAEDHQPGRPPLGDAEVEAEIRPRGAERKAMHAASLKNCEERYAQLIQAQPGWAPKPRAEIEKEMMDEFKVTRTGLSTVRSEAIRATYGGLARTRGGRSVARQATREKTLPAKPRAVLQIKNRKAQPFMQWARGPGGKPVLQCAVYVLGGSRLCPSLNTSDTETEGPQRMRLLLWHAIAEEQLPSGVKHPAWGLYGGPIPQSTKRLLAGLAGLPSAEYELLRRAAAQRLGYHASTIDWLTNQDKARQADPVRWARVRTLARSGARKKVGMRTPISRSWQFGPVGGMLVVHRDGPIYAQLTIAGFTLRWRLAAQNRAEGEALLKPAVDARARVREAARNWRECLVESPDAKTALATLLGEQRRFRDVLLAIGANAPKAGPRFSKH
jgi:hypothetical protein